MSWCWRAGLGLLLLVAGAARATDTLRPEDLRPGQKGYGLSVFQGTEPARFEVEVVGVLPNAFPKQDMILIKLSGADLEKHKVIAGMSGSPIYINGKLIGALAYGWSFENDPLAGVTPIHNMRAELNQPAAGADGAATPSAAAPRPPEPAPAFARELTAPPGAGGIDLAALAAPRPLLTPLSLGGFSARTVARLTESLAGWGLLPVAVGGPGLAASPRPRGTAQPGGAIGVELIRGDFNAVAVGTITEVVGHRVLAFGHPFLQAGQITAPAVEAEVHTIMSSLARSFKLATGRGAIGAMVGDWQSGIVADTGATASMIPLRIRVRHRAAGHDEQYAVEVVDNPVFSPVLVRAAVAEAVAAASGSSRDTTLHVTLVAETASRTVRVADTFFNPQGSLESPAAWAALGAIFQTPFGRPGVRQVSVEVTAEQQRRTATIRSAFFPKAEAEPGETLPLRVVVEPFGEPLTTLTVLVKVPADPPGPRLLAVTVVGGNAAPPDAAPPDSVATFLDLLEQSHQSTDLVALVADPGAGLAHHGRLLKNLPSSAVGLLEDAGSGDGVRSAINLRHLVVPTRWILSGQAGTTIPIREE